MFLFIDPTKEKIELEIWDRKGLQCKAKYPADQNLSAQFLTWIDEFLSVNTASKEDLKGLVVIRGPGSFTTLRVVVSTLNALAYALDIPIIGVDKSKGFSRGIVEKLLGAGNFKTPVAPYYKEPPKVTKPRRGVVKF
ncbi:hypothetical protein E3J85_00490 [Patescibacteria group bacterium]|nr:MAG: hypothetical protein E3J85_00490 [Patescibacteria group bacterium]